jgi:uncharacterized protein (TIGR03084 family)
MNSPISQDNQPLFNDLLAEYQDLFTLCQTLDEQQWQSPTRFYGWTPWDEIAHLAFFDHTALVSCQDPPRFREEAKALGSRMAQGESISGFARSHYGHMGPAALLDFWQQNFSTLIDALSKKSAETRLDWYGPPMSLRSFATARMMETWAHGQDIWDLAARKRPATQRLKHIAHLGFVTYGWSFVNRKQPAPPTPAALALTGPDNELWTWGDVTGPDLVRGRASDFCLVVTQRRNYRDTDLQVTPGAMSQWMQIAQCFAGPAVEGPQQGRRVVAYGV